MSLSAPVAGTAVPLGEVKDPAFAQGLLGKGAAIVPEDNRVVSPCGGIVDTVYDNGHAISLVSDFGAQVLIHMGLHTVNADASLFTPHVADGQSVRRGQLLISFDREAVKQAGFDTTTPIVICNSDDFSKITVKSGGNVTPEDCLVQLGK